MDLSIKNKYQLTQIIPSADSGDIQAMYDFITAVFVEEIEIEESDKDIKDRVWEYSNKLYAAGELSGLYHMACCYMDGYGVERDAKKAIELFTRLGEEGDSFGYEYAAKVLFEGKEIEKDDKEAFRLQSMAGSRKYMPESFYMLGDFYRKGTVAAQDYAQSFIHYVSALNLLQQMEDLVGETQPKVLKFYKKIGARAKYWCVKYIRDGRISGIDRNDPKGAEYLIETCDQVSDETSDEVFLEVSKEMVFDLFEEVFGVPYGQ